MKRAGLGIDRYVKLEDPSKSSYRWVEFAGKKLERGPEFEKEYGKYYGIIVKLEYLKNHGMIPFGAAIQNGAVSYTHLDVYKRQTQYLNEMVKRKMEWKSTREKVENEDTWFEEIR